MLRHAMVEAILVTAAVSTGFAQDCLHGSSETPDQTARRAAAIRVARQINTAQARVFMQTRTYQPLSGLPKQPQSPGMIGSGVEPTPEGFELQLTTDGTSYAFSLKDKRDPCGYSIFSDQEGVIYNSSPLQ